MQQRVTDCRFCRNYVPIYLILWYFSGGLIIQKITRHNQTNPRDPYPYKTGSEHCSKGSHSSRVRCASLVQPNVDLDCHVACASAQGQRRTRCFSIAFWWRVAALIQHALLRKVVENICAKIWNNKQIWLSRCWMAGVGLVLGGKHEMTFNSLYHCVLMSLNLAPLDKSLYIFLWTSIIQHTWQSFGDGSNPLIPFLEGWTSIYQLFWCSPGVQGFDTLPFHPHEGRIGAEMSANFLRHLPPGPRMSQVIGGRPWSSGEGMRWKFTNPPKLYTRPGKR